ncbi:MAG: AmmeMemoRadiSam system protein A [Bacteroidetes bacterium]|nr:AmmeMemoRadiSam system protein A [Bacteroidota bacterium]
MRNSIVAATRGEPLPPPILASPTFNEKHGVFVTLKKAGELRGCIGFIESEMPLIEATQDAALKAAREDPRFDPVTEDELDDLTIEISILSPIKRIATIEEIEVGKHGLILEYGPFRGLLLPQVATEYGWSREQFLEHTARKAGLPPTAWKREGVHLYTFTVQKFSEKDFTQ